jgi:hypothetical protein
MPIKSVTDIRLTAMSDAAWAMADRAREEGNDKLEVDALRIAKGYCQRDYRHRNRQEAFH